MKVLGMFMRITWFRWQAAGWPCWYNRCHYQVIAVFTDWSIRKKNNFKKQLSQEMSGFLKKKKIGRKGKMVAWYVELSQQDRTMLVHINQHAALLAHNAVHPGMKFDAIIHLSKDLRQRLERSLPTWIIFSFLPRHLLDARVTEEKNRTKIILVEL